MCVVTQHTITVGSPHPYLTLPEGSLPDLRRHSPSRPLRGVALGKSLFLNGAQGVPDEGYLQVSVTVLESSEHSFLGSTYVYAALLQLLMIARLLLFRSYLQLKLRNW
jgi:hypothetical protein